MLQVRLWVELLFNVKKENNNMGLRGIVEVIISPRRVSKNLRRWKLTSHKIYLQISLSWKVTLLLREEEKRGQE